MWWFDTCAYCDTIVTTRLVNISISSHSYNLCFVMRTFKIYCSLSNFQIYNVNYSHHALSTLKRQLHLAFTAASLTTAETRKQPKCSSTDRQILKMVSVYAYIHTHIYVSHSVQVAYMHIYTYMYRMWYVYKYVYVWWNIIQSQRRKSCPMWQYRSFSRTLFKWNKPDRER